MHQILCEYSACTYCIYIDAHVCHIRAGSHLETCHYPCPFHTQGLTDGLHSPRSWSCTACTRGAVCRPLAHPPSCCTDSRLRLSTRTTGHRPVCQNGAPSSLLFQNLSCLQCRRSERVRGRVCRPAGVHRVPFSPTDRMDVCSFPPVVKVSFSIIFCAALPYVSKADLHSELPMLRQKSFCALRTADSSLSGVPDWFDFSSRVWWIMAYCSGRCSARLSNANEMRKASGLSASTVSVEHAPFVNTET